MSFSHWITVAVVAFLPLAATAQQSQQPGPADANATVPTVGYVSAFENYRATPEEKATPDQLWRAANEEITSQDMQGDHMAMPGMAPSAPGKPMSMPGMKQGEAGNNTSMPGMEHGASENHMSMPGMGPAASGKPMSMPGMGGAKPEPKADAAPADPHAGHHNMQGK